ncbi:YeeE/YedE family protein [Psychromonas sp. Urea-02u-13]|uniref:YeeE/YedE family protein n=1 Tax=Psychromonas sp. Urea-02u-13 TaxID=2058326 RepID=UPI000C34636A|nr:YeeE/YedE family protein [Psychromonas sp. Urea-02u-13]PKG37789.1 YeeE/YedE family protein [Psychromonas sp. Urea-02u-13]
MQKSKFINLIISLVSGLLFGAGMIVSGMVDPNKVIGFLNVTGNWDPSLAFVMGGALAVFTPIYHLFIKQRQYAINGEELTLAAKTKVDSSLITGAAIFGAGWGLAGFCPGPAITSISAGSHITLAFVVCMIVGIMIANRYLAGRFALPFIGYNKT